MKRTLYLWCGVIGFIFLLASCAPTAHIKKDDAADFKSYKTFAWAENNSSKKNNNRREDLTGKKIKEAVNNELEKSSGWKESKHNPDILLTYDILVERSVKQQNDPVYSQPFSRTFYNPYSRRFINVFYPSQFVGYDDYNVPTKEGTVTVSMIDTKTDKTVWQGWTTNEVNSRNLTDKEIESSVKTIFRKFDVVKN